MGSGEEGVPQKAVLPWRRGCQFLVLAVLVAVPWFSRNPEQWSPSRLVQRQLPPPSTFDVSGDTWSFAIGDFRLVHPVAFVESWLAAKIVYLPLLTATLLPLAVTLVLGRVFCSWMCPVGLLLELNMKGKRVLQKRGMHFELPLVDLRYPLLVVCLVFGFVFAFPLVAVFDPPHVLGRELMYLFVHREVSLMGTGLLLGIVLFELFCNPRAWCGRICPSGAGLALLSRWRGVRIGMYEQKCIRCEKCDAACPYQLMPMNLADGGGFDWNTCDNCGLCRDVCPTGALTYGVGIRGPARENATKG